MITIYVHNTRVRAMSENNRIINKAHRRGICKLCYAATHIIAQFSLLTHISPFGITSTSCHLSVKIDRFTYFLARYKSMKQAIEASFLS
jgi:hypothetical protein